MVRYALIAFFGYFILYFVSQQIILGFLWHGRNVRFRRAPGFFVFWTLSSLSAPIALYTMEHQRVRYVPIQIGCVIILAGLLLTMWAEWHIGTNWSGGIALHKKHELVKTGPYRYIRHPIYAGISLSMIGLGVFGWNVLFLLCCFWTGAAFAIGAIGEEFQLRDRFKDEYTSYMDQTGMFIPRIRKKKG